MSRMDGDVSTKLEKDTRESRLSQWPIGYLHNQRLTIGLVQGRLGVQGVEWHLPVKREVFTVQSVRGTLI
jgi:hypothetical protein